MAREKDLGTMLTSETTGLRTANQITSELLIRIPEYFPQARVWRNNRIKAKAIGRSGALRMVSAGINGQGDITGLVRIRYGGLRRVAGIRLEIEVKAGRDRQSAAQKNFQKMIEELGGIYILATEPDAALNELQERVRQYSAES
jgi:hypothetical protein